MRKNTNIIFKKKWMALSGVLVQIVSYISLSNEPSRANVVTSLPWLPSYWPHRQASWLVQQSRSGHQTQTPEIHFKVKSLSLSVHLPAWVVSEQKSACFGCRITARSGTPDTPGTRTAGWLKLSRAWGYALLPKVLMGSVGCSRNWLG